MDNRTYVAHLPVDLEVIFPAGRSYFPLAQELNYPDSKHKNVNNKTTSRFFTPISCSTNLQLFEFA